MKEIIGGKKINVLNQYAVELKLLHTLVLERSNEVVDKALKTVCGT